MSLLKKVTVLSPLVEELGVFIVPENSVACNLLLYLLEEKEIAYDIESIQRPGSRSSLQEREV